MARQVWANLLLLSACQNQANKKAGEENVKTNAMEVADDGNEASVNLVLMRPIREIIDTY